MKGRRQGPGVRISAGVRLYSLFAFFEDGGEVGEGGGVDHRAECDRIWPQLGRDFSTSPIPFSFFRFLALFLQPRPLSLSYRFVSLPVLRQLRALSKTRKHTRKNKEKKTKVFFFLSPLPSLTSLSPSLSLSLHCALELFTNSNFTLSSLLPSTAPLPTPLPPCIISSQHAASKKTKTHKKGKRRRKRFTFTRIITLRRWVFREQPRCEGFEESRPRFLIPREQPFGVKIAQPNLAQAGAALDQAVERGVDPEEVLGEIEGLERLQLADERRDGVEAAVGEVEVSQRPHVPEFCREYLVSGRV